MNLATLKAQLKSFETILDREVAAGSIHNGDIEVAIKEHKIAIQKATANLPRQYA